MTSRFGIYKKLVLVLLLTVILPLIACSVWLFTFQKGVIYNFMLLAARREITQMAEKMNYELSQLQIVGNQVYLNEELIRTLNAQMPREEKSIAIQRLVRGFGAMTSNLSFRILFLDSDGNAFGNALHLKNHPTLQLEAHPWRQQFLARPNQELWITDPALDEIFADASLPNIYLARELHHPDSRQSAGMVILSLSEKEISKKYMGYLEDYQNAYLLKEDGSVISSVVNSPLLSLPADISKFSDVYLSKDSGQQQMISYYTVRLNQWKFLIASDYAAMIHPFASVLTQFLLILVVAFILIIAMLYIFIRHLVAPVKKLHKSMTLVRDGDLSVRVDITTRDEIGELSEQFNRMIERINKLMTDKLFEQGEKRKAEIKALQAQIHPHFLYNALASVRGLMMTGDLPQADQALLSLVHILKNMLSDIHETVTLRQELMLLKEYIKLQQLSFSSPFQVEFKVQDDLNTVRIPKLLLQPLVENAILHGLKPSRKPDKTLRLTAQEIDGNLNIQIQDNGVGFCDPDASQGANPEDHLTHSGVGLENVRERIRHSFGEGYGLLMESQPKLGTLVSLTLPMFKEEVPYVAYQ